MEDYDFYTNLTIPGGTYNCVADDVETVAVMATIVARNDVPEDTIAANHEKGKLIDLETAVSGITIPFHPGAEKYFKEQGAL